MFTKIFPSELYQKFSFIFLLINITTIPSALMGMNSASEQGFGKGTLIKTEKGYVAIEKIKKNDRVISYDLINNVPISDRVIEIHHNDASIIAQLMTYNQLLSIGHNHPIYLASSQKWINVSNISEEAIVKTFGNEIILKKLSSISLKDKTVPLYCLSMAKNHNFFASSEEILVHNMGGLADLGPAIYKVISGILGGGGGGIIMAPTQDDIQKMETAIREQQRYIAPFGYDDVVDNYPPQTTIPTSFAADEIRPGNSRSITLNIHGDRYAPQEEPDWKEMYAKKQLEYEKWVEEECKKRTTPRKIEFTETRRKGWLWGWHTEKVTRVSYVSEQEYRKNRNQDKQVFVDGTVTKTVRYHLHPDSPLAKQLTYEDAMAQQIKDAEASLTPGCLFNPELSIPEFLFIPIPAPIKIHEGILFTPMPTGITIKDQFFTVNGNSDFFSNKEDERETGAQAPGKPRAIDGWNPPKKWDGKKRKMQGGRLAGKWGWPDDRGKIWVPTGPKDHPLSHRGPHWDVAYPDGNGHENRLPKPLNCEIASSSANSSTFESSSLLSDTWSTSYSQEQVEQIQKAITEMDEAVTTYDPEQYQTEVVDKFNNLFSGLSDEERQSYKDDLSEILGDSQTNISKTDLSDPIDRAIDAFSNEAERIVSDKDNNTYAPNDFKDWFSKLPEEEQQSYLDDTNEFMSQNKL